MKALLISFILLSFSAFSQSEPHSGMYWNIYSYYNPAMSGVKYKHEANVTNCASWSALNGSPSIWHVNYGTNIFEKHGVGVNYSYQTVGSFRAHRTKLNYNYQLKLANDQKLVFGVAPSFVNYSWAPLWTFGKSQYPWPAYPPRNDINVDLGVAYYGKRLIAGLSTTQIPIYKDLENDYYSSRTSLFGNLRYEASLFGLNSPFIFETALRTDFIHYTQNFNVGYRFKKVFEAGLGLRTNDAVLINFTGIFAKKFRVGYSNIHSINSLNSDKMGTHEFALGLRIPNS